jgi:hypothetical protein
MDGAKADRAKHVFDRENSAVSFTRLGSSPVLLVPSSGTMYK